MLPFSLFYCPTSVQDYFRWSLIPCSGPVPRLIYVLGTSSLLLCPFCSKSCKVLGRAELGALHFLWIFVLPCLTLRTSMGPGRSSVLRIGSNPAEASGSGRTNEGTTIWLWWFTRLSRGNVPFPWIRVRENLTKFSSPVALSI